jgi:thiol:disulfide interchange protein DsbD
MNSGIMNRSFYAYVSVLLLSVFGMQAQAQSNFLPPDQAFHFSAQSVSETEAELSWDVAPHYYLYHDQFKVMVGQKPVKLKLPAGKQKNDPTFGLTNVHYNHVSIQLKVKPSTSYLVLWQGCSEDGLCYPLQRKTIQTDASGLLPQQQSSTTAKLLNQSRSTELFNTSQNSIDRVETEVAQNKPEPAIQKKQATELTDSSDSVQATPEALTEVTASAANEIKGSEATAESESTVNAVTEPQTDASVKPVDSELRDQLNNDQLFFSFLKQDQLLVNLLIFFILGILLAFLPCSLPLIPILSGIILQRASGYKAAIIALSFIVSMALVYSLMGIVVAEIGYSFQRWFQSPVVITLFAVLFVIFALNLFGLYQLTLPQPIMQKLGNLQNRQKGGSILSAAVMGALSALIVGPCMSAPLAGALLFVSQSHSATMGGLYLFIMGMGMGLPLFIVSVFGSHLLPQPGIWMDRLKACFGFIMLMVALYFIRPMLNLSVYHLLFALLAIGLCIYLLLSIRHVSHKTGKAITVVCAVLTLTAGIWQARLALDETQTAYHTEELQKWHKVSTEQELQNTILQLKKLNKPIVIDVYADWCVACQPIEQQVFPRADVQQALKDFSLIKLDLTQYNASQDNILKKWEILGPPTLLILDSQAQEIRQLRLTGTFSAKLLIKQLQQVNH